MKYKILIFFFLLISCAQSNVYKNKKIPFNSMGFAYIYNEDDFNNKIINKKFDNNSLHIAHSSLRVGSLIKIINPKTNDSIILKNSKKLKYPDFYKILITKSVAKKINLETNLPFVEVYEVKQNKSFVAQKTKTYIEEKKIHSNAPVEKVTINNISLNENNAKIDKDKIFIIIGEFYSKNSAQILLDRITSELLEFDRKKIQIKTKKANKIILLSGPYTTINSMKNDYIQLKKFGFEELDISINE